MIELSQIKNPLSIISQDDVFQTEFDGLKQVATATKRNRDLMYVRYIFCHEGANENGDFFFREELENAKDTPKNKPINWEHSQPIIGVVTDSVLHKPDPDSEDPRWYIECAGVIWKYMFPEFANEIYRKATSGMLRNSMECYFTNYVYVLGTADNTVSREEAPHLEPFIGRVYKGVPIYRGLKGVLFGGSGVVANPADKDAIFTSVAKKIEDADPPCVFLEDGSLLIRAGVITGEIIRSGALEGGCTEEVMSQTASGNQNKEVRIMANKDELDIQGIEEVLEIDENLEETQAEVEDVEVVEDTDEIEENEAVEEVEASEESEKEEDVTDTEEAEASSNTEKDALIAELTERIAQLQEANSTLQAQFNAFMEQVEAERREREKAELAEKRINDLLGAGLVFSKETLSKIRAQVSEQSESQFLEFKQLLIEARFAGAYAKTDEDNQEDETTEEDLEEVKDTEASESEDKDIEDVDDEEDDSAVSTGSINLEYKRASANVDSNYVKLASSFFGRSKISTKM